jgi:hypothetical protein
MNCLSISWFKHCLVLKHDHYHKYLLPISVSQDKHLAKNYSLCEQMYRSLNVRVSKTFVWSIFKTRQRLRTELHSHGPVKVCPPPQLTHTQFVTQFPCTSVAFKSPMWRVHLFCIIIITRTFALSKCRTTCLLINVPILSITFPNSH